MDPNVASSRNHGIAAVVALLQNERRPFRKCSDGLDRTAATSTLDSHTNACASDQTHGQVTTENSTDRDRERTLKRAEGTVTAERDRDCSTCGLAGSSHDEQPQSNVSSGRATGDAILAELHLEDLQAKRRRLVKLSHDVLEARCPGFCTRTALSEDECLREASCALADISSDVHEAARSVVDAARAIRTISASSQRSHASHVQ